MHTFNQWLKTKPPASFRDPEYYNWEDVCHAIKDDRLNYEQAADITRTTTEKTMKVFEAYLRNKGEPND